MKNQKQFWKENLKFLRERKKMTQEGLAKALEISRAKLNALENGQTKNPPIEDLLSCSEYFKVSIDTLLKVDLAKLGELKMRDLEAGNDVYMKGGNLRILAITVDKTNKENIEFVPVKAKAGYRSGYNDPEFISGLPKFSLPNLRGGSYRMFPTSGDSMLPIPEGSDIVARYIADMTSVKPGTMCIVILKGEQDFVFKQVTITKAGLLLESLNPVYQPYEVAAEEVLELWEFQRFISNRVPEGTTDMDTLLKYIKQIQGEIRSLKSAGNSLQPALKS